jgi:hypothetical protein
MACNPNRYQAIIQAKKMGWKNPPKLPSKNFTSNLTQQLVGGLGKRVVYLAPRLRATLFVFSLQCVYIPRLVFWMRTTRMKLVLNIFGALLVLIGVIWVLQGVNVLPGSFMTGQIRWAIYGAITFIVGCAALFGARQLRAPRR